MIKLLAWCFAFSCFLGSCESPHYVPTRTMPARGPADPEAMAAVEQNDGTAPYGDLESASDRRGATDSTSRPLDLFCKQILARGYRSQTLGCLPLVSHDLRHDGPWVSECGVDLADEIAERLRSEGFRQTVLDTNSSSLRISRAGLERGALSTLETVVREGPRLELDLVVFGTIRRQNDVGRAGRDVLVFDVNCFDFARDEIVAREKFEVPSDDPRNARIWRLAQQTSLWNPAAD